jgi:hypothetical protein
MSFRATRWVLEHSPVEGAPRLVLLSLASHASSDGRDAFPSVETIRCEARLKSHRTVQNALRTLVKCGAIETQRESSHEGCYRVLMSSDGRPTTSPTSSDGRRTTSPTSSDDSRVYEQSFKTSSFNSASACFEESVEKSKKEPSALLFSAWQELFDKQDAVFSPARKRVAQRALAEESDVAVLICALRGFKRYREQKPGLVELGQIFGTWKDTGDLSSRIEWLCSLDAQRGQNGNVNGKQHIEGLAREVGVDPLRIYRHLDEIRYTLSKPDRPERARAERARAWLISQGLTVVRVPEPMLVDVRR